MAQEMLHFGWIGVCMGKDHFHKRLLASGTVLALLLASAPVSYADLMLQVSSGADTVTVTDNGSGDIANGVTGLIIYSSLVPTQTTIGNFKISSVTGESYPYIGTSTDPIMDLDPSVVATAAGTLTIKLTDTDFSLIDSGVFLSSIGGTAPGGTTITLNTYCDSGNTAFGTGTLLTTATLNGGSFSGDTNSLPTLCGSDFSLTQILTIKDSASGVISLDAELSVPEPATLFLFGAGLLGVGVILRRQKKT